MMRIKLHGKEEFEAFVTIVRILIVAIVVESLPDWCNQKSLEKLALKLFQIAVRGGQFKKKIIVKLDELQTALLYEMLQQRVFASYELNLANRIIAELEQQYYNARALQMAIKN
jgi:predicted RNA-binding protein associated with RNAse of E/G family